MCFDPISIGLLIAGTAASFAGNQIAQDEAAKNAAAQARERNRIKQEKDARLRAFEDENRAKFSSVLQDQYSKDTQAQTKEDAQATREQAIAEAITPTAAIESGAPLGENTPEIIKGNVAKKLRDVFNAATENARLQAVPQTFSDVLAMNDLALTGAGRNIDTLNSFARQEAAMLPSQQDLAAYSVAQTPSGWGNLLKSAGTLAAGAGGSGYFRPTTATAPTALTLMPTNI